MGQDTKELTMLAITYVATRLVAKEGKTWSPASVEFLYSLKEKGDPIPLPPGPPAEGFLRDLQQNLGE